MDYLDQKTSKCHFDPKLQMAPFCRQRSICFLMIGNCRKVYTRGCVDDNIDICIKNKIFVITKIHFLFHELFKYFIFIMVYLQLSSKICILLYW